MDCISMLFCSVSKNPINQSINLINNLFHVGIINTNKNNNKKWHSYTFPQVSNLGLGLGLGLRLGLRLCI